MKERSLVAFTILSQTAVGSFLALLLIRAWLFDQIDIVRVNNLTSMVLLGIGLLVVSSLLASTFHLGRPLNSWRAISNLRTSWLSREILCAILFTISGGLFTGLLCFQIGSKLALNILGWMTAVFGFALVYSMAKVYTQNTLSAWVNSKPLLSFLITTLLLGGLFSATAFTLILFGYAPSSRSVLGLRDLFNALTVPIYGMGVSSLILISADFIYILRFTARKTVSPGYLHPPDPIPARLKKLSLALLALSAVIILSRISGSLNLQSIGLVFLAAFGLVMIAEIIKRILFYDSRRPEM